MECEEYDTSSPFPLTKEQVHQCGQNIGNSIAALFAQQAPAPEISYAVVVAEELELFTKPIIDFTMHQFGQECCFNAIGNVNFSKAAANKALSTLDKILVLNNHYQLMSDFSVWDVYNPPSLEELKLLASRHPFQPISALIRKEILGYKNDIHVRLKTIITHRDSNSGCETECENESENCVTDENEQPPSRYCYPNQDEGYYWQFENNRVFNVRGGKLCEELNSREYTICINELLAFYINSEAKFTKVYTKDVSKCFLMPAEFKDEAMRKYFMVKFKQFRANGSKLSKKVAGVSLVDIQTESMTQEMDFAAEHAERRSFQHDYLRRESSVELPEAEVVYRGGSDVDADQSDGVPLITVDNTLRDSGSMSRSHSYTFNSEVRRAQKDFIDAREVCLIEWELRDRTLSELENLCTCLKEIVSGNHGVCDCGKQDSICKTHMRDAERYLKLLRDANRSLEDLRPVSQCLDKTLLSLQSIYRSSVNLSWVKGRNVDVQDIVDSIDDLLQFYTVLGTHTTSLFYQKNKVYEKLKARSYAICSTCCIRTPISEDSEELKDALPYKELHAVDDDEVTAYEALRKDEEDERGLRAQESFHIEFVESERKYYHLLNIENPSKDNPLENKCCLIKDGKLTKLPACDDCYDRMKKATKYLEDFQEI